MGVRKVVFGEEHYKLRGNLCKGPEDTWCILKTGKKKVSVTRE